MDTPDLEIIKEHYYNVDLSLLEVAKLCGISKTTLVVRVKAYGLKTRKELKIKSKLKKARRDKGRKHQVGCKGCAHYKFCKALPITEPVKCEIRWSSDDVPIDTDTGYIRSVSLGDVVRIS